MSVPITYAEDRAPRSKLQSKNGRRAGLEEEVLERQVLICKAFANSTRLHMLELLGKRDWSAHEGKRWGNH